MKERECREEREMEGCGVKGIIIFICAYHILLINCTLSLCMHKIHNVMLVLFELHTWCWYAHYLSAIRTRSQSGDGSNLHLVLLPFNQLP